jgi:hypothetical protein
VLLFPMRNADFGMRNEEFARGYEWVGRSVVRFAADRLRFVRRRGAKGRQQPDQFSGVEAHGDARMRTLALSGRMREIDTHLGGPERPRIMGCLTGIQTAARRVDRNTPGTWLYTKCHRT